MKGVNRADQYLSYYSILRKTSKWTKCVVMYLINCALFSSYIVYNSVHARKMKYKKFLYETALYWLSDSTGILDQTTDHLDPSDPGPSTSTTKKTSRRNPPTRLSMDMRKHVNTKIISTSKKKIAQKKRSETSYMCKHCEIPLHRGKCFNDYHTKKHY